MDKCIHKSNLKGKLLLAKRQSADRNFAQASRPSHSQIKGNSFRHWFPTIHDVHIRPLNCKSQPYQVYDTQIMPFCVNLRPC